MTHRTEYFLEEVPRTLEQLEQFEASTALTIPQNPHSQSNVE
jgi:hypothetical protein